MMKTFYRTSRSAGIVSKKNLRARVDEISILSRRRVGEGGGQGLN
jgi:hypothetical protein